MEEEEPPLILPERGSGCKMSLRANQSSGAAVSSEFRCSHPSGPLAQIRPLDTRLFRSWFGGCFCLKCFLNLPQHEPATGDVNIVQFRLALVRLLLR